MTLDLLGSRQKVKFFFIVLSTVVMAFTQIAGVGLIIPFASLLLDSTALHNSELLEWTYQIAGFHSEEHYLLVLGCLVLFVLVLGNAYSAFTVWLMTRFTWYQQYSISVRLLSRYLNEDYSLLVQRKSSEIVRNIIFESMQLSNGVMLPLLHIIASGLTLLCFAAVLIYLNPLVSTLAVVIFSCGYAFIYLFVRKPMLKMGELRRRVYKERLKGVNEAFGATKEVKVMGLEGAFHKRYQVPAWEAARAEVAFQVLAVLPRYLIEALAFGMVMAILLVLLASGSDMTEILPIAVAYMFAAYRILPALQVTYRSIGSLRFNRNVLFSIHKELVQTPAPSQSCTKERLKFETEIQLINVSYHYPGETRPALDSISLKIAHGSHVAFVGKTGAGKTTLSDLILGLIRPEQGQLFVDGQELTDENRQQWQRCFGLVPQEIYLLDDTIAANIAFGVPHAEIDMQAVQYAAQKANIDSFIKESLSEGYQTHVGERGVRLSGGQRQRIGLARAFYHNPPVLLLDEATSALDSVTEQAVQKAIVDDAGTRTVVVIAHRLSTIRACDCIYYLENGRVVDCGTFDDLLESCEAFRAMVNGVQHG